MSKHSTKLTLCKGEITSLAVKLRKLRRENDMSQAFVANAVGLKKQSSYQAYEAGASEPPSDKLAKLADLFGVSTDYLLGRETALTEAEASLALDLVGSAYVAAARGHFEELMRWAGTDRKRLAAVAHKLQEFSETLHQ